jgi:heterodisulfide reductase subunit C
VHFNVLFQGMCGALTEKSTETSSKNVDTARVDPAFKREVMNEHDGETLKKCFQCGTCTSSCPTARFSDSYRPRTVLRMAQLGLRNKVLSSSALWLCTACFTCTDRCPQGVEVASVLRVLRNLAVKKGVVPQVFIELNSSINDTGYAYRIPDLRHRKRAEAGLPPLPKANCKDVSKLLELTCKGKMPKK